jgi:hypothetical protein
MTTIARLRTLLLEAEVEAEQLSAAERTPESAHVLASVRRARADVDVHAERPTRVRA